MCAVRAGVSLRSTTVTVYVVTPNFAFCRQPMRIRFVLQSYYLTPCPFYALVTVLTFAAYCTVGTFTLHTIPLLHGSRTVSLVYFNSMVRFILPRVAPWPDYRSGKRHVACNVAPHFSRAGPVAGVRGAAFYPSPGHYLSSVFQASWSAQVVRGSFASVAVTGLLRSLLLVVGTGLRSLPRSGCFVGQRSSSL